MKKILIIPLLLIGFLTQAQQYAPKVSTYGNWYNRLKTDSALHLPRKYSNVLNDNDTTPQIFIVGTNLIFYSNGSYYSVTGGATIDTTSLSNRINARVQYLDTASMLSPYLRSNIAASTYYPLSSNPAGYSILPNVVNSLQVINAGGSVSWQTAPYASRPAAGIAGRYYTASDTLKIYYDNGTVWQTIAGGGVGGSGAQSLTGDVFGSISGTNIPTTLATVNPNVFGSQTPLKFSVNGKGLVTGATALAAADLNTIYGYTPYNGASNPNGYISLTSLSATSPIVYNSGTGAFTFATSGVTAGSYTNASITIDAFGRITTASSGSGSGQAAIQFHDAVNGNLNSPGATATFNFINSLSGTAVSGTIVNAQLLNDSAITSGDYYYGYHAGRKGWVKDSTYFVNLLVSSDSVYWGGPSAANPDILKFDAHISGSNVHGVYWDSLFMYYSNPPATQSSDTSTHKLLVWNSSTKRIEPMFWSATVTSLTSPNSTITLSGSAGNITEDVAHPNVRQTSTVSSNTSFSLTTGDWIKTIIVKPTSNTTNFQVGTTASGFDVVPTQNLTAGTTYSFPVNAYISASTTYYFQNISSSTVCTIIKEQ